jgi:hypothetical protein
VDAHTVVVGTGNGNRLILHVNPLTGAVEIEDDEATR